MKKILAGLAVLLVAAAAGVYFSRPGAPLTTLPPPDILTSDTSVFPETPAGEPIPTTRPAPEPGRLKTWECGTSKRFEDASLREVLASTIDNDPNFGQPDIGMAAAECAARRWRLSGI